jgi:hypothetical protein
MSVKLRLAGTKSQSAWHTHLGRHGVSQLIEINLRELLRGKPPGGQPAAGAGMQITLTPMLTARALSSNDSLPYIRPLENYRPFS